MGETEWVNSAFLSIKARFIPPSSRKPPGLLQVSKTPSPNCGEHTTWIQQSSTWFCDLPFIHWHLSLVCL